jgi:hypothetical protein
MSDPTEVHLPLAKASVVELVNGEGGYVLVYRFDRAASSDGTPDPEPLPGEPKDDAEAIWIAEEEIKDIFGRIPPRENPAAPPPVARWVVG